MSKHIRTTLSALAAALYLGSASPGNATDPATVAAGMQTLGSIIGSMANGPDLNLAYAAETYALLQSTNTRLTGIETALGAVLRAVSDSQAQVDRVTEALALANSGKIENGFSQIERAYFDGEIDEVEFNQITVRSQLIESAKDEMQGGPYLVTGPSLILEPLYRLAARDALSYRVPLSQTQAEGNLNDAIQDIEALVSESPVGPLFGEYLSRAKEVQDAYDEMDSRARVVFDTLMIYWRDVVDADPNGDQDKLHTTILSNVAFLALEGPRFDNNFYCLDYEVSLTRRADGKAMSFAFVGEETRVPCTLSRGHWLPLLSEARPTWEKEKQMMMAALNRYAHANNAAYAAKDIVRLGQIALYGLRLQTPGLITPFVRARAEASKSIEILQALQANHDATTLRLYLDDMARRRKATTALLAASRERIDTAYQEAEDAQELQRVAAILTRAGQALEAGIKIEAWLKEQGFFEEPDLSVPLDEDAFVFVDDDDPAWVLQDQQTTALRFATNRKAAVRHMEGLVAKLKAAGVSDTPGRLDFEALAYIQLAAGAPQSDVLSTIEASGKTRGPEAKSLWQVVMDKIPDALVTALTPNTTGDGTVYGREHESHILAQLLGELAKREAERARMWE